MDLSRPVLLQQSQNTDGLMNIIEKTHAIANTMSSKVRALDVEQSRVRSSLRLLDQIKDLQQCLRGVQHALRGKQYPQASDFIRRFLQTDIETISKVYDAIHVQMTDEETFGVCPIPDLRKAQKQLVDELQKEFDLAVKSQDVDGMVKIFKLFPIVGAGEVGLEKYADYVFAQIRNNISSILEKAVGAGTGAVYVDCLSLLFENIASTIDRQEQMIEGMYGVGSVLFFISLLQKETDSQSCLLINSLLDFRQVDRKISMIEKTMGGGDVEPREVDGILGELAIVCHKAGLFERFIKARVNDEYTKVSSHEHTLSKRYIDTSKIEIPQISTCREKVQTCITQFAILCNFFLQKSISKVLLID
jgi:hypothetical protein